MNDDIKAEIIEILKEIYMNGYHAGDLTDTDYADYLYRIEGLVKISQ